MKLRHALAVLFTLGAITAAFADEKDDIRIGQTLPYSGPLSGFGTIGRTQEAFQGQCRRRHQWPQDEVHHA